MASPTDPTQNPSDPPEEVIELLNKAEQGYIHAKPINQSPVQFVDESEPDYDPLDAGN